MSQAFLGTRLSEHMATTPEGYLICYDAVLCRTAVKYPQKYRGSELGMNTDEIVNVYRQPEEVFNKKFLASLNGKPVTMAHPGEFLGPENVGWHARGHVQNVRPGPVLPNGEQSVVGDLIVTNASLIRAIRDEGLRELSVGYQCEYSPHRDGYQQRKLIGNHVACVSKGRAGEFVKILDAQKGVSEETVESGETRPFDELARELFEKYHPAEKEDAEMTAAEIKKLIREVIREELSKRTKEEEEETVVSDGYEHPAFASYRTLRSAIAKHGTPADKEAWNDGFLALKRMKSPVKLISALDAQTDPARSWEEILKQYRRRDLKQARKLAEAASRTGSIAANDATATDFEALVRRARSKALGLPEPEPTKPFGVRAADSLSVSDDEEWGKHVEQERKKKYGY